MPTSRQLEILEEPTLRLSELTDLVPAKNSKHERDRKGDDERAGKGDNEIAGDCRSIYDDTLNKWGNYFQSPVNKVARTSKIVFQFDRWGAFKEGTGVADVEATLFDWLKKEEHPDVNEWLTRGKPLSAERTHLVGRELFGGKQKLTNDSLYNQPICRLVHRNQLRRDLDYQVAYQLTPGQSRLVAPQDIAALPSRSLQRVIQNLRQNQRVYWGISETLQSLVAMFDSDLGSRKESKSGTDFTKEFIRITTEEGQRSSIGPDELNESSPLRFWAPPPAFAGSVFHMLFWRSVITGRDLFGRQVVGKSTRSSGSPKARASQYHVIINWFNAAKFRLAEYENLFAALMAIARRLDTARVASTGESVELNTPLSDLEDVDLSQEPLLFPRYFPHSAVKFPQFKKVNLIVPFSSLGTKTLELAWEHRDKRSSQTRFIDVRKFLRDKALELVLWSKYQMEIRSVGLIPIQYLYHVELTGGDNGQLLELSAKSKQLDDERDKDPHGSIARKLEEEINAAVSEAIMTGDIDNWIVLRRIFGGTYRTVFRQNEWKRIDTLKSPRSVAVETVGREARDDISRTNAKRKLRKPRSNKSR